MLQRGDRLMKSRGMSHATLMLLVCALPLLIFFALALAGVQLSPLWVPLIMILCCLAMFYLTAGACHEHVERVPEAIPAEPTMLPAEAVKIDDVFRVNHRRRVGDTLFQEGELLRDPDETYAVLKERAKDIGVTPLLQEDQAGRPLLVWLPGAAVRATGKQRGPWLNVLLLLLTFLTTTWAGALHSGVDVLQEPRRFLAGLSYSLSLLLILGAHELGHYFAARAHQMKV